MGRVKTYEAIVKGQNVPKPGIPESFKVLIKELQSLGLDVRVLDKDNQEIDLKQNFDGDDIGYVMSDDAAFSQVNDAENAEGYGIEASEEEEEEPTEVDFDALEEFSEEELFGDDGFDEDTF